MTDAIVWKYAHEDDLARLATRHSLDECKSDLATILRLDPTDEKQAMLLDFHVHNYSYPLPYTFCRQQRFSLQQTSVLLGMCQMLMDRDLTPTSTTDLGTSFAFFQSLLLTHSVDRPPKSIGVFAPHDVAAIVDFVAHTYFRHLQLYKRIFTPFAHTLMSQVAVAGVETPLRPRALALAAVLHTEASLPLTTATAHTDSDAS